MEKCCNVTLAFQVQTLNMSLSDSAAAISELQERIAQLQRALTSSEHDRRVLQERLETTRYGIDGVHLGCLVTLMLLIDCNGNPV